MTRAHTQHTHNTYKQKHMHKHTCIVLMLFVLVMLIFSDTVWVAISYAAYSKKVKLHWVNYRPILTAQRPLPKLLHKYTIVARTHFLYICSQMSHVRTLNKGPQAKNKLSFSNDIWWLCACAISFTTNYQMYIEFKCNLYLMPI